MLKNSDFLNAQQGLNQLIQEKLPVSISLKIIQQARKIETILQDFNKQRDILVKQYSITDKTNVNTPEFIAFNKDWNELINAEVEWVDKVIKIPGVVNGKELTLSPASLILCTNFIEIEDVDNKTK